jgi:hypothetical protein
MPLRIATIALTFALLATACTGGSATPESTRAAEVVGEHSAPAAAPVGPTVGVWVVDSQTGYVAILYEGDAQPLIPDAPNRIFNPSGVVWLPGGAGATRHAPGGLPLAVIEAGFGVTESTEASARAYDLASDAGAEPVLVIERPPYLEPLALQHPWRILNRRHPTRRRRAVAPLSLPARTSRNSAAVKSARSSCRC